MHHPITVLKRRTRRALVATALSYLLLAGQLAPVALAAGSAHPRRTVPPAPQAAPPSAASKAVPVPQPLALAPVITATKTDSFNDPNGNQKAEPGDTITYSVTISNTGTTDATNVTFTDTVDPNTTIVPGSVNAQPIATGETFSVLGNVRIQVPDGASDLLANDRDPDTDTNSGLTASGPTTSAQGGNVVVNADGSFSYNPAPGFEGTDSFVYTVTGNGGQTDTATVTLNVSGMIWFVDANQATNGDGRLTSPFNCLVGAGCFDPAAADDAGDNIFLYASATSYNGGLTLLANQKLIGQGASAGTNLQTIAGVTVPAHSDALPALNGNPASVNIVSTTNGVNLPASPAAVTLRGFTVGNTTGTDISSGANFGTLNVSEVILNGTGRALNLTNGALNGNFVSVTSSSSGSQGVNLVAVSGTLGLGSTTVSGNTGQCVLVTGSSAALAFGNTSCTGGTDGVSLQNNTGANARTFGTLGVTGGSGNAFLHANGGGNTTVTGAANLSSNLDPVSIANAASGTAINFSGGATVQKTTAGGNGVNWAGANTGATLTFATLTLTTSNGAGMNLQGGGAVNVTNAVGSSISTTGTGTQASPAITVSGVAIGLNFTTVTVNGAGAGTGQGISLTSATGSLTVNNGASTATNIQNTGGAGINVLSSSATLNFGNTTVNATGGTAVILGTSGNGNTGAITFGAVTVTPDSGQRGLHAHSNTGQINVSSGAVTTTNNTAVQIEGATSGSKTPLNISLTAVNTTGGAVAPNGIFLRFTSDAGNGFRVVGNGGTCTFASSGACTGGRITNTSGADNTTNGIGVYLEDVADVNLTRMRIDTHTNHAIRGRTVNGFTLNTSVVDGNNGTSSAADNEIVPGEDSVRFNNLLGSALIDNSTIAGGWLHNLRVTNNTGTLNRLTVQNSTIGDPDAIGSGQRGLGATGGGGVILGDNTSFEAKDGITAMNVSLLNSTLNFGGGRLFVILNNDNVNPVGTVDAVVRNNTLVNANPFATQAGASHVVEVSGLGHTTYEIACNKIANSLGIALLIFKGRQPSGQPAGNFSGTIFNNTVGITGQPGSGGGSGTAASAINVDQQGTGTGTVLIKNNVIRRHREAGIRLNNIDNLNQLSTLNATVIGNTVAEPDPTAPLNSPFANVYVNAGADPATDANQVTNLKLGHATNAAEKNTINDNNGMGGMFDAYLERTAGTFNLSREGSGGANAAAVVATNNIVDAAQVFANASITLVNTVPALPAAINESCSPPAAPDSIPVEDAQGSTSETGATEEATTANAAPSSFSGNTNVTEQPFVLFRQPAPAQQSAAPAANESGNTAEQNNAAGAPDMSVEEPKPLLVTVNGDQITVTVGTLRAGDSVTITFQVTVDNPYTGPATVSNQGSVSYAESGTPVLTDDPDVAGANNPTLTPINSMKIAVRDAVASEPPSGSNDMVFTVTLSDPVPAASTVSVNFATADDTGGANPATSGTDYTPTSGTITFNPGERVKTINVPVLADADAPEPDETFLVNLTMPVGGDIIRAQAVGTIRQANPPGTFIISEIRTSGPAGSADEFVELYNNTDSPLTVAATDSSAGFGVFKMGADCTGTPVLLGTIPNGTVIPARGHYLLTGAAYSLSNYGGTGAAATNLTMTSDIENDRNVAVFSTDDLGNISSVNRLDAVGFGLNTGEVCGLMRESTTLPAMAGSTLEYSFFRDECGKAGNIAAFGPCPVTSGVVDMNVNATDFIFADTTGASTPAGQRLGAPGPQNLASPINRNATMPMHLLDNGQCSTCAPNRVRVPGNDGTNAMGTISLRRRIQNNTGGNVTRLRLRIIDVTTAPAPGTADVRARNSSDIPSVSITNDSGTCGGPTSCTVTVLGTTVETPPAQPLGGAFNSTWTVTLGTPLANGQSVNIQMLVGVMQGGSYRIFVNVEALP